MGYGPTSWLKIIGDGEGGKGTKGTSKGRKDLVKDKDTNTVFSERLYLCTSFEVTTRNLR
jgi:hypothetical protein